MRYFLLAIFVLTSSIVCVSANESLVFSGEVETTESVSELILEKIQVVDNKHIRTVFNAPIDIDSLTLRIEKQSPNTSLRISMMTGVVENPEIVEITLIDELEEASHYTLTVIAGVSISGATISDGAGAIQDFVTPSPLKKAPVSFSAPPNPSAVIIKNSTFTKQDEQKNGVNVQEKKTVNEPVKPTDTEELPLTGMNPIFLILLILPVVYIFMRRRV